MRWVEAGKYRASVSALLMKTGEAQVLTLCLSCRLAKEDMQFQRQDGLEAPLNEAHGDFLQRLLPRSMLARHLVLF